MGIYESIVLIEKLTYTLTKLLSYKRVFIFYYTLSFTLSDIIRTFL